jgi:hypothetical protein
MAYIYDLADTWNASGTTFTAIKMNVTDTASAAASLLMDLQVGGVSKFSVDKTANIGISGSSTTGYIKMLNSGNYSVQLNSGSPGIFFQVNNAIAGTAVIRPSGFNLGATSCLAWCPNANRADEAADLTLFRDGAANTLAQRNGVNAQTHRLYGTYTDASNYRRLTKTMSTGGIAEIKPEGAGTGASGNVLYISGLPTSNPGAGILWNNLGAVVVGT